MPTTIIAGVDNPKSLSELNKQYLVPYDNILVLDRDPIRAAKVLCDSELVNRVKPYITNVLRPNTTYVSPVDRHWRFTHYYSMLQEGLYRGILSKEDVSSLFNKANKEYNLVCKEFTLITKYSRRHVPASIPDLYYLSQVIRNSISIPGTGMLRFNRIGFLVPGRKWTKRSMPLWYKNNLAYIQKEYEERNKDNGV